MSSSEIYEESYLECYCGAAAKLRMSHTEKNPFRLFYNCPKELSQVSIYKFICSLLSLPSLLYLYVLNTASNVVSFIGLMNLNHPMIDMPMN